MTAYNNELLYYATEHSNRIEQEPVKGRSFDNHWRATLLARTAAQERTLLHPRVLHQLLFEGLPLKNVAGTLSHPPQPGDYRPLGWQSYVRRTSGEAHYFTDASKVPALMEVWWAEYLDRKSCANKPCLHSDLVRWWFHAWFEAIHPFVDGNGRVGRLLWWNMTMLAGDKIEVVAVEERQSYYDRLEDWRHEHCNAEHMNPFR